MKEQMSKGKENDQTARGGGGGGGGGGKREKDFFHQYSLDILYSTRIYYICIYIYIY